MTTEVLLFSRRLIVWFVVFVIGVMALSCAGESVALAQYYGGGYNNGGGYDNTYNNGGGYDNAYNNGGGYGNTYNNGGGYANSYGNGGGYDKSYDNDGGHQQAPAGDKGDQPAKYKKPNSFWTWLCFWSVIIFAAIFGVGNLGTLDKLTGGRLNKASGGAVDALKNQQGNNQNYPPNQRRY